MPLPGDNTFGRRKGSYSPTDDNLDSTPYKPVPLAFQQADGTMPMDNVDRNANKRTAPPPSSHRLDSRDRKKRYCIIAAIAIAVIILLILILTLSICLGTDMCSSSSSSSSSSPSKADSTDFGYRYKAHLLGHLRAPVIADSGFPSFTDHLNGTLEGVNATIDNSSLNASSSNFTFSHRRRRQADHNDHDHATDLTSGQPSIESYLEEKLTDTLLHSLRSSELCELFDCVTLKIDELKLERQAEELLTCLFNATVGSNDVMIMQPQIMEEAATVGRNFSRAFNQIFPGYRLEHVQMTFHAEDFCAYESVLCYNFTWFTDSLSTPMVDTSPFTVSSDGIDDMDSNSTANANANATTVPDRSELLPPIIKITDHQEPATARGEQKSTTIIVPRTETVPAVPVAPPMSSSIGVADCSRHGFLCANQHERIGKMEVCDGVIHCSDGSDEASCPQCLTAFSCPKDSSTWLCRRGSILCDGRPECPTHHDESTLHCKTTCRPAEYKCRGASICIPKQWLCDGDPQCPQGDDESDCRGSCNHDAMFCASEQKCIARWNKCNGVRDCSDGTDEEECSCVECSGNSTALCTGPIGRCILRKQVCDGKRDCPDGEDELNCS